MATKNEIQINACKKRIEKIEKRINGDLSRLNKKYLFLVKKGIFEENQFDLGDDIKNKKFTSKKSEQFYSAAGKEIEKIRVANLVRPQDREQKVWDALFDARSYANDFRIDSWSLECEKETLLSLEKNQIKKSK
ncbi:MULTISPECIES: hypothetical protein [unclassified Enterococcus]|uniref:hypothetical protein n=1 Tax=unclassified Enterococcus TaxID=2608891 RepID=UPI001CE0DD11|nr:MULTISPECIES: hypothetical protein [unclassified Enterococcus]MCA5014580.1 hypothetical protein [Enterococcus sp. S23]MCA5017833.1 hypothetical protein [Enterococcus sp. S22(2020)]